MRSAAFFDADFFVAFVVFVLGTDDDAFGADDPATTAVDREFRRLIGSFFTAFPGEPVAGVGFLLGPGAL